MVPNAILENNNIYRYRDLYEVQLQSKITNFLLQINDPNLLGYITNIRLKQLQSFYWLRFSPLYSFPYDKTSTRLQQKHFIFNMLILCKQHNFSINLSFPLRNEILEGTFEIRDIFGEKFFNKVFKQLRNRSIMYLDQITSLDGQYLLTWRSITKRNYTGYVNTARIPLWYKSLQKIVLL